MKIPVYFSCPPQLKIKISSRDKLLNGVTQYYLLTYCGNVFILKLWYIQKLSSVIACLYELLVS